MTGRVLSILAVVCLAGLALSCARHAVPERPIPGPEQVWSALLNRYAPVTGPDRSLLANGVMHYQGKRVSGRVAFVFLADLPGPVRLDISSGFGQTVAMVRETSSSRLAYYPDDRTAYLDPDPEGGLAAMGLPIPFPLRDLARVLGGEMAALLPERYEVAEETSGGCVFGLADGPISALETDSSGRPLALEGESGGGWRLEMSRYPEDNEELSGVPRKYVVAWGGKKATLRITTLTLKVGAWPPGRLEFPLPEDTATVFMRPLPTEPE